MSAADRGAMLLVAGVLLVVPIAASCDGAPPDAGVEIEVEAPDKRDCEKAERAKKEQDDCGRMVGGRYVEWSWVRAGKTEPPPGWTPASEPKPTPAPTTSKKAGRR